jgi:hypothetical protein
MIYDHRLTGKKGRAVTMVIPPTSIVALSEITVSILKTNNRPFTVKIEVIRSSVPQKTTVTIYQFPWV